MNRKIVALIVAIIVIAISGFGIWMINSKSNNESSNTSSNAKENNTINNNENNEENGKENTNKDNKIAVIYFSATGTTKEVAKTISNQTKGELIEIKPKEKYTSEDLDWNNSKSRTSVECNDSKSRPEIEGKLDIESYDTIYLGYPIWWGDVPHIILTFLDTYKLDGKTVIPFCTSGGTGISTSQNTLKKYNKNINWIDGKRLSTSESEIKNWINTLNN